MLIPACGFQYKSYISKASKISFVFCWLVMMFAVVQTKMWQTDIMALGGDNLILALLTKHC